jgi:hypothetical protein
VSGKGTMRVGHIIEQVVWDTRQTITYKSGLVHTYPWHNKRGVLSPTTE